MKRINTAGLFGASVLAMTFASLPSKAAVNGCGQGGDFSSGQFLYSDIVANPSFACQVGDKEYSHFSNFNGFVDNDTFTINVDSFPLPWANSVYTLAIQAGSNGGNFGPGNYGFDYKVSVRTGDNKIVAYSTGATTPSQPISPAYWTKELTSTGNLPTATTTSPFATSPNSYFTPWVTSADFSTYLEVSPNAFVTQFADAVYQQAPQPTPSPLPLLGASAAFGFSRRIRARIRKAS